ncbi:epoxyqueuosine reductase [Desulfofundulus sp. TPOSR]|uniref:epoxyqueuosine reductase n=1 Tax=Desulfofundulus sp. TPOSR TaxID=2714340 RepID=UPI00140E6009|nr:epoxyqueuosine reductase [Desulfofundulus sp. TPOSR]NHM26418.1 epoxyqueuosine reductase [Desulfofundulus sp. TPOSR]
MEKLIEEIIARVVKNHRGKTGYRTPLVGFARAGDPGFAKLKEVVGSGHLLPQDLLPGARSVVAFFLPFTPELVNIHRRDPYVSRRWAEAYIETNQLIGKTCRVLARELEDRGVKAAWCEPTHNFDPVALVSFWSHKHVACLCGLGTFGLHHMLITPSGCAGRLGSLVVDVDLSPNPPAAGENCLYRREGSCTACVKLCPTGALSVEGLDKEKCYRRLLEVDAYYTDLGLCDVCGKCATGPCALGVP